MGKVIAAFAGTGKTHIGDKYENAIDLDLGSFRWIYDGPESLPYEQRKAMRVFSQNPDWPQNYIDAITESIDKFDLVLVSYTPEIAHLVSHNFIPGPNAWGALEARYRARGNPERFVELFRNHFQVVITMSGIQIKDEEYLEDALKREGFLPT